MTNEFDKKYPSPADVGKKSVFKFSAFKPEAPEQAECLLRGAKLYLPTPKQLNDPFECSPHLNFRQDREQLYLYFIKVARDRGATECEAERFANTGLGMEIETLNNSLNSFGRKVFEDVRVSSFTSCWRNQLLWAHYANSHQGFCLEFDATKRPFEMMYKVDYRKDYPKLHIPVEANLDFVESLLVKGLDWEYEQEFRFVVPPEMSLSPRFDGQYLQLLGDELKAVYIGVNMGGDDEETLRKHIDKSVFNPKIYKVETSCDSFELLARESL